MHENKTIEEITSFIDQYLVNNYNSIIAEVHAKPDHTTYDTVIPIDIKDGDKIYPVMLLHSHKYQKFILGTFDFGVDEHGRIMHHPVVSSIITPISILHQSK